MHRMYLEPIYPLAFPNSSQVHSHNHSQHPLIHVFSFVNSILSYVPEYGDIHWSVVDLPGTKSLSTMTLSFLEFINRQCSHYGLVRVECLILCRCHAGGHSCCEFMSFVFLLFQEDNCLSQGFYFCTNIMTKKQVGEERVY